MLTHLTIITDCIGITLSYQLQSKGNSVVSHPLKKTTLKQEQAMTSPLHFLNLWTFGYFQVCEEDFFIKRGGGKSEAEEASRCSEVLSCEEKSVKDTSSVIFIKEMDNTQGFGFLFVTDYR